MTAALIELFAWLGLIYDLKTASPNIIKPRVLRTGDGTHHKYVKEDIFMKDEVFSEKKYL